jgi:hypothetical protein
MHLENKFYKKKYDVEKCLKIAKPYPIYITIFILLIMVIFTSLAFSYSYMAAKYIGSLFY